MSRNTLRLILSVLFISSLALGLISHQTAKADSCIILNYNLSVGASGTDVATLQNYLISQHYLTLPADVTPGYFGNLTKKAVKDFQNANGIDQTGFVGSITRAKISLLTCG